MFLGGKLHVEFLLMFKANSDDRELKKKEKKKRNRLKFNYSQLKICTNKEWLDSALSKGTMLNSSCASSVGHFCIVCFNIHFLYFQGETCSTVPWNTAVYRGPTIRYDKNTEKKKSFFLWMYLSVAIFSNVYCALFVFQSIITVERTKETRR